MRKTHPFALAFTIATIAAIASPCAMAAELHIVKDSELDIQSASIQQINEKFELPRSSNSSCRISIKQKLTDGDTTYKLFPTFDDPSEAIAQISHDAHRMLSHLQAKYELDPISTENWNNYREAMYQEFDRDDCPNWFKTEEDEYSKLLCFFDIYENDEQNTIICDTFSNLGSLAKSKNLNSPFAVSKKDLFEMLPNQDVLNKVSYDTEMNYPSLLANGAFDKSKGIAYAKAHATNPNESAYGYIATADCTNFVSQILEKGGVAQDVYVSINKGWWHKKIVSDTETYHTRSKSWTAADVFANYMGVGYQTTSNSSFSSHIKSGDFIAADWSSDGSWDHMGFVVLRKSEKTNGYYNYKVAQHTKNYLAWTSSATNNWEKAGSNGGTYARIRR